MTKLSKIKNLRNWLSQEKSLGTKLSKSKGLRGYSCKLAFKKSRGRLEN